MLKIPSLLTFVFALAACSSHNPFENTRGDWRIDGTFVNFKTTSLPGTYSTEENPELAYLNLSPEGRIEFTLPSTEAVGCQLHVAGELVSMRALQPGSLTASAQAMEFSFGSFKGSYSPESTHVLVVLTDLDEESDPSTVSIEKIFEGQVIETLSRLPATEDGSEQGEEATDESEELDPATACLSWDISNNYDYARRLFMLPVQWEASELIVDGLVLQKD